MSALANVPSLYHHQMVSMTISICSLILKLCCLWQNTLNGGGAPGHMGLAAVACTPMGTRVLQCCHFLEASRWFLFFSAGFRMLANISSAFLNGGPTPIAVTFSNVLEQ